MTTAQHDLAAIRGIMADIDAEHDLSPAELRAILAILAPAHARALAVYRPAQHISFSDLTYAETLTLITIVTPIAERVEAQANPPAGLSLVGRKQKSGASNGW